MKGMQSWKPFGKHLVRIEQDTVFVRAQGDITGAEVVELCDQMLKVQKQYGCVFEVVDARASGTMNTEARRMNAEWYRRNEIDLEVAIFGASRLMRGLFSLIINAIRLLGGRQPRVQFVATEAEALDWVEQRRQQKRAGAAAGH